MTAEPRTEAARSMLTDPALFSIDPHLLIAHARAIEAELVLHDMPLAAALRRRRDKVTKPHEYTDHRGRNLCDRCNKWAGNIAHPRPAPAPDPLRTLLVQEHRRVVSEYSGNFAGHVGIRDGWVEYDGNETIEDCDVCAALREGETP